MEPKKASEEVARNTKVRELFLDASDDGMLSEKMMETDDMDAAGNEQEATDEE